MLMVVVKLVSKLKFKNLVEQVKRGLKCPKCGSLFCFKNGSIMLRHKHKTLGKRKIQQYQCLDCGLTFNEAGIIRKKEDYIKGLMKYMKLSEEEARRHIQAEIDSDLAELEAFKPLVQNGILKYIGKKSKDYQIQKEYWKTHGKKSEHFEQSFQVKGKMGKRFEKVF